MAQFCINIADGDVDRVITALCANYGYSAQISNPNFNGAIPEDPETNPEFITNPETRNQFANRMTRTFLMENTIAYELKKEKEALPQPTPPDITND